MTSMIPPSAAGRLPSLGQCTESARPSASPRRPRGRWPTVANRDRTGDDNCGAMTAPETDAMKPPFVQKRSLLKAEPRDRLSRGAGRSRAWLVGLVLIAVAGVGS